MGPFEHDVPNKGVGKKWAWACCLPLLLTVVVPLCIALYLARPNVIDRSGDWSRFYESYVSNFGTVPPEASIIEATETKEFMFGGGFKVVFTLPETKTPEEWMLVITSGGGSDLREHNVSPYHYEVRGSGDVTLLRYFPEEKHYVLRNQWD